MDTRICGIALTVVAMAAFEAGAADLREISRRPIRCDSEPLNFCFAKRFPDRSIYLGYSIGRHMVNERHSSMFSPDDGQTWQLVEKGSGMGAFATRDGLKRFVSAWNHTLTNEHFVTVRTIAKDGTEHTVKTRIVVPRPLQLRLHREVARLGDGSLILTGYSGSNGYHTAYVVKSDDDGLNWRFLSFLPEVKGAQEGVNEAATVQLKDGRILAFARTGCFGATNSVCALMRFTSRDGGKTWGEVRVAADYGVDPQAGLLSDGTLFLLSGRPGVYLMLDPTGTGEHFRRHEIYAGPGSSYSTLLEPQPGKLLLIYDESSFMHIPGATPTNRIMQVEYEFTREGTTDWMPGKVGAFAHYLPNAKTYAKIDDFDVKGLVAQLKEMRADYFVITLGQNTGYYCSPNETLEKLAKYEPHARCSKRDIPAEIIAALKGTGIRFGLYLPSQPAVHDDQAETNLGFPNDVAARGGDPDRKFTDVGTANWAKVIETWARRYGKDVSFWWFDGSYAWLGFNGEIAARYRAACQAGNPDVAIAFNAGVRYKGAEKWSDVWAGEESGGVLQVFPTSRWAAPNLQWQVLSYLGKTWGEPSCRFTDEQWRKWLSAVTAKGGCVTLDMHIDPATGRLEPAQVDQFRRVRPAVDPILMAGDSDSPVEAEVAVRSTLDGTQQPVRLFVPVSARGKKVPLLVALHTWSYDQRGEWPWNWAKGECEKRGWVLVYPRFRGPNWTPEACGSDLAVQDILDAVDYAKTRAGIDGDRVYLVGGSGGGHMALLMAGRHPEVWAGVYSACPITDIARWHADSIRLKNDYHKHIETACGGRPDTKAKECRHRSPLTWLETARKTGTHIQIATGIHDGHGGNSVPVGHAIRAYNALADVSDAISEANIAFIEAQEKVPEQLLFAGNDPFFNEANRIHLRRTSANVRFTLFEGGHGGNFEAGIDWLARQRRGRPVDWSLPLRGTGRTSEVTK